MHLRPLHDCVPAWQLPLLHVPASVSDAAPAVQMAAEHVVPSAYLWQPPAPSHRPLVPQLGAPLSAQASLGSMVPAATGVQVPVLPATLQAWQEPQAALPQQTLSTQWPVPHWLLAVQPRPTPTLAAQLPPAPVQ
jgi:hypothetical protein